MNIKGHWKYLQYVLRHKWWVAYYGWQLKLPLWILIFHDWDKFLPDEWQPYVDNFYGKPLVNAGRLRWRKSGCPCDISLYDYENEIEKERKNAFDVAWLYHQNKNKHHWQYWILTNDDDGVPVCLPMPDKYRREMLADWRGAGHAINGFDDTQKWYIKNYDNIQLHPETRAWVDAQLEYEVSYVT